MLRLPTPALLLSSLLFAAALPACGSGAGSLPTEYVTFKYNISGGGTETGDRVITNSVAPGSTLCGRASSQLYIVSSSGLENVAIKLNGTATAGNNLALEATAASKGVAEVVFNLPTVFDQQGNGSMPLGFTTTMAINPLTCTLSLLGADPFAAFDGDFKCSSISGASGSRLTVSDGHYHIVSCP